MSVEFALAAGRRAAERLMVDACTIMRAGTSTTDDLTGEVTDTPSTVYSGRCKVQQAAAMGQRVDAGEGSALLMRREVHLPIVGSEAVRRGDRITITVAVNDSAAEGRPFIVRDEFTKSYATARRLGVEEVT